MTTRPDTPPPSAGSPATPRRSIVSRIAHVEGEHTRITSMLEKATQAFVRHAGAPEVNAILLELSGYTLAHFREEEELMLECEFPGLEAHRNEHNNRLADYVRGLLDMRSKQEALQCAVSALDLWLDAHIRITDREFCDFLQREAK